MAGVTSRTTPIVALDVPSAPDALRLVDLLGPSCRFYKIGSELFTAAGPTVVHEVRQRGAEVFLDLKFHDIPNTVRGAVASAVGLGVSLLTVHASGGSAMLRAATSEVEGSDCRVLAVSILTSFDASGIGAVWGRAVPDLGTEVLRMGQLAAEAGIHGLVCSGQEAAAIRDQFNGRLETLVPGIRLQGGERQDQSRVVTPREAAEAGARYIVLGRAVTAADSPAAAMERVLADLS